MENLAELKRKILNALDFKEACQIAVRRLRSEIGHYHWVGIYVVKGTDLILFAWDGPKATEHVCIPIGKGICGTAAATGRTIIVDDVSQDPRYLQCFQETRAEIVVPLCWGSRVIGEIDIDSNKVGAFHHLDRVFLEDLAEALVRVWEKEQKVVELGDDTLLLHEGEKLEDGIRPIHYPLVPSTTYEFSSMASLESYLADETSGYIYSRWENPTVSAAERKLAFLHNAEDAVLFGSGMAAISTTLLSFLKSGDELIVLENLYGGTSLLFSEILPKFGIRIKWLELEQFRHLKRFITTEAKAVYFETITNPDLRIVDPVETARAAHERGLLVMVDNSMPTAFLLKPLEQGADIVIESVTKGLAGHSDVTGGMVCGKKDFMKQVRRNRKILGTNFNAWEAFLLSRGLETFALRQKQQNEAALFLAEKLEKERGVQVYYPGLPSHPEHALAKKFFHGGYGGIVTITLEGGMKIVKAFVDSLRLWKRAASFGGTVSLVSIPVLTSHWQPGERQSKQGNVAANMVRLSPGLERKEDLLWDLKQALESRERIHALAE